MGHEQNRTKRVSVRRLMAEASKDAAFVTGTTFVIDGGLTMQQLGSNGSGFGVSASRINPGFPK